MTDPSERAAPARAWRVVLEKIEGDLLEGRLGPGDRLPPERELASTLGADVTSISLQELDLVNDTTLVDVRYRVAARRTAGVALAGTGATR